MSSLNQGLSSLNQGQTTFSVPSSLAEARALIAAVRVKASGREIPEPPEEPLPESCCGRGCEGCVFVTYYAALDAWRRDAEAQ